ncbi:MAG: SDR family NAD(P)-dependent oxidoreductase [Allosphingosinicella sp.]
MPSALVTGASAGIGRSFAVQLAAAGYDLVLVARRRDRLEALARELSAAHGVEAEILPADLSADDDVATVERRILDSGPLDLVINNAGYATRGAVAQLDAAATEKMLRVNIFALVRLSAAAMRRMTAEGKGAIVNVASGTVFMQMPGNAGYGASKNFVVAFTRHMQVEAAGSAVQVQLLIPGVVATEFHDVAGADLNRFPPQMVMQADDLVAASLKALETGEPVCIPSLPEAADWQAYVEAEGKVAGNVSRQHPAERYL